MPELKKNKKNVIAITGANGFVGSHVVKYLIENTLEHVSETQVIKLKLNI